MDEKYHHLTWKYVQVIKNKYVVNFPLCQFFAGQKTSRPEFILKKTGFSVRFPRRIREGNIQEARLSEQQMKKQKVADYIRREYGEIIGFIRRQQPASSYYEAEDVLGDVLVSIFQLIHLGSLIDNIPSYLYRSIKNKLIDIRKNLPAVTGSVARYTVSCVIDLSTMPP